jgi:hypothetical protein
LLKRGKGGLARQFDAELRLVLGQEVGSIIDRVATMIFGIHNVA